MAQNSIEPQFLRVRDFCRILSLPSSTAYRMIAGGQLQVVRLAVTASNPRGVLRIPRSELERVIGTAVDARAQLSDESGR